MYSKIYNNIFIYIIYIYISKIYNNNIFAQKPVLTTVPKLELRIVLPYLGNISSITKKRLNRCISKCFKFCKIETIFQTGNKLRNYFRLLNMVFLKP